MEKFSIISKAKEFTQLTSLQLWPFHKPLPSILFVKSPLKKTFQHNHIQLHVPQKKAFDKYTSWITVTSE